MSDNLIFSPKKLYHSVHIELTRTKIQAMAENAVSISTRQASEMLGVHESSVKRWCNADALDYWLTPGGHRRIPIVSLVAFARDQGIDVPLRPFGLEAGEVWAAREGAAREDDFEALVDLAYAWLALGQSWEMARLVEYLLHEGFPIGQLFDRLVGPVMHRIGLGYLDGSLSIGDEHRMTQAMRDTLLDLRALNASKRPLNGRSAPTAVVGCARNEVHELGALMVRLMLEYTGWQVVYLGLNVPTEEFATQQTKYDAALVCISMMPPMGPADALTMVRLLDRMYDPTRPYRLALGGSSLGDVDRSEVADLAIPDVQFFASMEPFAAWFDALDA